MICPPRSPLEQTPSLGSLGRGAAGAGRGALRMSLQPLELPHTWLKQHRLVILWSWKSKVPSGARIKVPAGLAPSRRCQWPGVGGESALALPSCEATALLGWWWYHSSPLRLTSRLPPPSLAGAL